MFVWWDSVVCISRSLLTEGAEGVLRLEKRLWVFDIKIVTKFRGRLVSQQLDDIGIFCTSYKQPCEYMMSAGNIDLLETLICSVDSRAPTGQNACSARVAGCTRMVTF